MLSFNERDPNRLLKCKVITCCKGDTLSKETLYPRLSVPPYNMLSSKSGDYNCFILSRIRFV